MAPLRGPRFRSHAGRPLRTFREARRRGRLSAAAGCGEHTVRWSPTVTTTQSTRLSEPWRTRSLTPEQSSSATSAVASSRKCSRPAGRAETPEAGGKGIARPEQPREPKQSWRAQSPHASMSAIPTARQVCRAADFPASTITCCMGTGRTEGPLRPRSHDCRLARRSGHLVLAGTRAAPYRPERQRRPSRPHF